MLTGTTFSRRLLGAYASPGARITRNLFLLVAMFLALNAFLWTYIGAGSYVLSDQESAAAHYYYSLPRYLVFVGVTALMTRQRVLLPLLRVAWPIWVLSAYFTITTLWASDRSQAMRSIALFDMQLLLGMALCASLNREEIMHTLRWIVIALLIVDLVFALALPHYGFENRGYVGALRGVFPSKNDFGAACAAGAAVLVTSCYRNGRLKLGWKDVGLITLALALLAASRSASSILAAALAIAIVGTHILAIKWLPNRAARAAVIVLIGIIVLIMALNADAIVDFAAGLVGRDTTLTGRTLLWDFAWRVGASKPVFGYGFNSFWGTYVGPNQLLVRLGLWEVAEAHNGFLEAYLNGGLVGMSLTILFFVYAVFVTVHKLIREPQSGMALLAVVLTMQAILQNMTESLFPNTAHFTGTALTIAIVLAHLPLRPNLPADARRRIRRFQPQLKG